MECCQATFDIVAVTGDDGEDTLSKRQFQMSMEEALRRIAAQTPGGQPMLSESQLTELIGADGSTRYQGPVLQEFRNIAQSITRFRPGNSSIRLDRNVWWMQVIKVIVIFFTCSKLLKYF
ncbi:unnamed protein product [Trichobilharzia szidati]|nr:unnamed protein product [Trichobilharzia szidati]